MQGDKQVFVVTVLLPRSWSQSDCLSAINTGIRYYASENNKKLSAMDYHAMAHASFKLEASDGR
jgi:hypothetical protein